MTTTQGASYLINLTTLETLEVQFVYDSIEYARQAEYADLKIISRNEPKIHYTGGRTTLPLIFDFYAKDDDRNDVMRSVKWLEALTMMDGYEKNPPNVKIVFGEVFRDEIWRAVAVKPKLGLFMPAHNFLPHKAMVSVDFVLNPESNTKLKDVQWT